MPEMWVNIYLGGLICLSVVGILLLLRRMAGRSPDGTGWRTALRRKSLIRECLHLAIGVVAFALFKLGVLGGWTVLGLVTALLVIVEYTLSALMKPGVERAA
jgi:hypothetical protein